MNSAVEVARAFFSQLNTPTSGELLQAVDVYTMMRLIPFGKRMTQEAHEQALECRLLNKQLECNAIKKDITTISNNLKALKKAYELAMN